MLMPLLTHLWPILADKVPFEQRSQELRSQMIHRSQPANHSTQIHIEMGQQASVCLFIDAAEGCRTWITYIFCSN